jgi:hypothetical protein
MSSEPSYRKINYMLRPAKQIERKLILQGLITLREQGYAISKYRYVGMGSVYFADFLLFHRYLFIDDMLCAEDSSSPLAMAFNKPYEFIEVRMASVGSVVGDLDRNRSHLVWLDYDSSLSDEVLDDVGLFASSLAAGSMLIITVRAKPPEGKQPYEPDASYDLRLDANVAALDAQFGRLAGRNITKADLTRMTMARLVHSILNRRIQDEIARRPEVGLGYGQLFSYRYADGTPMVTIGGLIDSRERVGQLMTSDMSKLDFLSFDPSSDPIEISVPMLTIREKHWLEQNLSKDPKERKQFEISKAETEGFKRFYRHYPYYVEGLF